MGPSGSCHNQILHGAFWISGHKYSNREAN
jgi:hypothetical protein